MTELINADSSTKRTFPTLCASRSQPVACRSVLTILTVSVAVTATSLTAICYGLCTADPYIFMTYTLPLVHKKQSGYKHLFTLGQYSRTSSDGLLVTRYKVRCVFHLLSVFKPVYLKACPCLSVQSCSCGDHLRH